MLIYFIRSGLDSSAWSYYNHQNSSRRNSYGATVNKDESEEDLRQDGTVPDADDVSRIIS